LLSRLSVPELSPLPSFHKDRFEDPPAKLPRATMSSPASPFLSCRPSYFLALDCLHCVLPVRLPVLCFAVFLAWHHLGCFSLSSIFLSVASVFLRFRSRDGLGGIYDPERIAFRVALRERRAFYRGTTTGPFCVVLRLYLEESLIAPARSDDHEFQAVPFRLLCFPLLTAFPSCGLTILADLVQCIPRSSSRTSHPAHLSPCLLGALLFPRPRCKVDAF